MGSDKSAVEINGDECLHQNPKDGAGLETNAEAEMQGSPWQGWRREEMGAEGRTVDVVVLRMTWAHLSEVRGGRGLLPGVGLAPRRP